MFNIIQIRRDGLYHREPAVYARTELSPQKVHRDSISQLIFAFEPFVQCEEKEAMIWISKSELKPQEKTDHNLAIHVIYSKPETTEDYIPYKAA